MCPVPKEVQEGSEQAVPVTTADATTDLDPTVESQDLINLNLNSTSSQNNVTTNTSEISNRYKHQVLYHPLLYIYIHIKNF